MKSWSRVVAVSLLLGTSGCGEGAIMVKEVDNGGVVVYPYRAEAVRLMEQKCPG